MSDYTKTTDFTAKDSLTHGVSAKRLKGSELDTEFDNIESSVATKEDLANKGVASGYAELNSSGVVPEDQLGSGTGTSAKYLRGDGTWQPESNFVAAGSTLTAASISYDHTTSGLTATQVQDAIDELAALVSPSSTDVTITGAMLNFNLLDVLYGGTAPSVAVTINVTVAQGALVTSLSTATPAMDLTGLHSGSTINLYNYGSIIGKGGAGGNGGAAGNHGGGDVDINSAGTLGGAGGDAIKGPGSGNTLNITNATGYIFGGGGGGGGGSWSACGNSEAASGGGGGGGAGGGAAGIGGATSDGTPGTVCRATNGGVGGVGRAASAGAAGAKAENGSATAGDGGAGGAYGAAGSSGSTGLFGTGGAAGKAIAVTSGTANFVSGNNGTHVKGAVS